MNMKASESFSAFLDGEASELDIQRMLKELDENPEALESWHGLSKAQAVMQGETVVDSALSCTSAAAEKETAPAATVSWHKRFLQGSVAAAVALVVVGTASLLPQQLEQPVEVSVSPVESELDATALAQQQFEAQQRLELYLREHAEQASYSTGHVIVPAELNWEEAEVE